MAKKPDDAFTRFQCDGCQAWLKAPPAWAGSKQTCPRCQTTLVVPSGEAAAAASAHTSMDDPHEEWDNADSSANAEREDDDPYEVEAPLDSPSLEALGYDEPTLDVPSDEEEGKDRQDSEYESERVRPTPPIWPFLTGIFTFPFYLTSIVRLATLSAWAAVVYMLLTSGLEVSMQGSMAALTGMCMLAAGLILGIMWLAATAACLLTVLQQTAHGVDAIEDWPDAMFIDWMYHGYYLITSTVASLLPGMAIAWALGSTGQAKATLMAASGFVLYPIVLLSMLEADSPIMPWSPPILASLFRRWWVWTIFYVETVALVAGVGGLAFWILRTHGLSAGVIMVPVEMVALFLYFRLLGRLALCSAYDPMEAAAGEHRLRFSSTEAASRETDD